MTEWHVPHKERYRSLAEVFLVVLFMCGGPLFALDGSTPPGYKLIPVTHIPPERAREFLTRLKIGTATRLPGTDSLLVTAEPGELQKAITVLEIVDTRTDFDVKELGSASTAAMMPSNEQIAEAVGGVSIGTFASPPRDKTKMRAIIDIHNGVVVAIAPAFQLRDIKTAVEMGPEVLKQRKASAPPENPAAITPTIQATALAESSSKNPAEGPAKANSPQADGNQKKFTLTPEMQQKLDEMRRRANEIKSQRHSAPVSQPDLQPAPVAAVDSQQASSKVALGQSNAATTQPDTGATQPGTDTTKPVLPPGLQRVGAEPQAPAEPEKSPEAAAGQTGTIRPGEVVPLDSNQVTPLQVESKPADQMPASPAQTPNPASLSAPTKLSGSPYEPGALPNGEQPIGLTLPEKLPIIQLLDLIGKYLNLTYVYDPAKVTGEVTLKLNGNLQGPVKVKDLYLLLEPALQSKDLVMTQYRGNIVKVVPRTEFLNVDPELVSPGTPVEVGDVVVTRVFELKHIETSSAETLLQGMGLAVGVTPVANQKTLIVTAYAHRMERIDQLLKLIDRPGEPRKFKFRQLRYTMAKTLTDKVKALAEQLQSVPVTVAEPEPTATVTRQPNETDQAYRTRLAQLRAVQASAARARAAAAGQVPEAAKTGVFLDADERTNRILMIGAEEQLGIVNSLVDALDLEQQDLRALQLYRMKHVDAEEVARKLQELGIISRLPETTMSTYSSRITGASRYPGQIPGQPRPPTPQTPDTAAPATELTKEGLVEEPQVVVVEATNALLVNATAEQHAKIASIIEYVDSEMLADEIPYKIYPLENSSPNHLAEVLQSLIQETVEQQKEGGKIEKTVVSRDEKIKIVPDPNTYSLIVYGNKKNQEWIGSLIKQLDKRRPQVLIDCTLVEVTKTDAFNYDLQLTKNFNNGTADSNSVGKFVSSIGGTLTAFYADNDIQAVLTAMQSKNYGRVLAKPKLMVNDNEKGEIKTEDTTYVEVTSSVPFATGTGGIQQNTVQTSKSFNPYNAGITLNITPHISEGDLLRLDIMLSRSDFLTASSAGVLSKPPDTRTNQVDTAVTLPNGSTVILGGLLKMNQSKGGSKVPILGDIPLIGGLFRTIDNEDRQSKLYVFVKAEILRPAEMAQGMKDLEKLSEKNRMAFEKHELEFQRYQDWPGIKPKAIDPPKVLDAQ